MRVRWTIGFVMLLICGAAWADGMLMPTEEQWKLGRERSLVNEPTQKAMVMLHNGVETMVISPGFTGNAAGFAWVVPVPKRPDVSIVKGALFHELARLISPPQKRAADRTLGWGRREATSALAPAVTVLERKPVGAYDVSILAATDSGALMRWLHQNRYHLPAGAKAPIAQYIREGWTFVACRVRVPDDARGLATGSLAPLKFTFKSSRLVYPMRLSSANPRRFDVLVYVVAAASRQVTVVKAPQLPNFRREALRNLSKTQLAEYERRMAPRIQQMTQYAFRRYTALDVETTKAANPTTVGLVKNTRFSLSAWGSPFIDPRDCIRDFVWAVN